MSTQAYTVSDSLVIIPTYNEKENIVNMLEKVMSLQPEFDVLIVDDGSPDGTADLVKAMQERFPSRIHLLEREGKLGLGTAYIAGFKYALRNDTYDFIFEMDADFSHDPDDLIRLRAACLNGADLSIGSRYVPGGRVKDWPWHRILISYCGSLYARSILWMGIRDTTSGFKCYRKSTLANIALDKVNYVGYAFQIAMKYAVRKGGFNIEEVPITFVDRQEGTSKMSMAIFKEGMWGVWQIRFSNDF